MHKDHVAGLGRRDLFPELEPSVYLNHAAISPPSTAVRAAVRATLDGYARRGVAHFAQEAERRTRLRSSLAQLLGVAAADVALVPNTSAGVVDIALCLPWRPGDRVLLFSGEFPANVTPWQRAAERHDLELLWLDAEDFRHDRAGALARMESLLVRGVRLVAVSTVQFATGQRMPLEQIGEFCRRHGAELFVDAIQSLGVMPLDAPALGIHYLSAGGHKWLMGPEGTGLLYVEPRCAAALRPEVAGWLSHESPLEFLFHGAGHLRYDRPLVRSARVMEGGTFNAAGLAGLEASVGLLHQLGAEAIFAHVQAWHDTMEPELLARGFSSARMADPGGRSAILSVLPPGPAQAPAWATALADHGVSCACPDGWLRLAPHWPNALEEPARVAAALDAIIEAGGPGHR